MRDFRKYSIWSIATDFATDIYGLTAQFPNKERFGLASQMQRAAISIPSNIAEGSSRKSECEFIHFLEIALGSAFELETQLIIANHIEYIEDIKTTQLLDKLHSIQRGINHLISVIRKQETPIANG